MLLVDTAGRLHIDDELMTELQQLKEQLNPVEILFVADAMTGQDAVKSADEFHKRLGITGVILTKMDGDARGGAALSIRHVTGQPLKFVGVGEKLGRARAVPSRPRGQSHPGHGRHSVASSRRPASRSTRRRPSRCSASSSTTISRWRISATSCGRSASWGRCRSLLDMMPKVGMLKELKDVKVDEKEINRVVAIIDSMTPRERDNHMIINGSRRRRIAQGSGTSVQEVNQLLKQYAAGPQDDEDVFRRAEGRAGKADGQDEDCRRDFRLEICRGRWAGSGN